VPRRRGHDAFRPDRYRYTSRRPLYIFGQDAAALWPKDADVDAVLALDNIHDVNELLPRAELVVDKDRACLKRKLDLGAARASHRPGARVARRRRG